MYDALLSMWRAERRKKELIEIRAGFYAAVREHLSHIDEVISKASDPIAIEVSKEYKRRLKYLLEDLVAIRREKIWRVLTAKETVPSLPIEEEEFAEKIKRALEALQRDIFEGKAEEEESIEAPEETERYEVVRFVKPVEEFVGTDMRIYGPYKEEEISAVPYLNARVLLRQGLAERVALEARIQEQTEEEEEEESKR